jgi:hypothetical protein
MAPPSLAEGEAIKDVQNVSPGFENRETQLAGKGWIPF